MTDEEASDAPEAIEPTISNADGTPPPLPVTEPAPWGFWATVGLGAAIVLIWLMAQTLVGIAYAVVAMAALDVSPNELSSTLETDGFFLSITTLLSGVVGVGLVVLCSWLRREMPIREYLGLHWPSTKIVVFWTVILLIVWGVSDLTTYLIGKEVVHEFMIEIDATARFRPLLWLAVIVMAPLFEESLFRGFLIPGLRRSAIGAPGAIVITSALWAMIHFQYELYYMGVIFVAGILLGLVRTKSGSLLLCIFLHMLMNTIATIQLEVYKAMQ